MSHGTIITERVFVESESFAKGALTFTSEETSRFHRDGYVIARTLIGDVDLNRMRQITERGLQGEIAPVEYEADLRYAGSPESLQSLGGHTVRRLKQAHRAKRVLAADAAYQDLLTRFPKPQKLDQVLDEWAVLNYEAQKYERADEIFRRLVQEMPSSELADNAQLSLAESELIASRLDAARQIFQGLLVSDKSDQEVKERSLYQLIVLAVDQGRWVDVRILDETLRSQFLMSPYRWYADAWRNRFSPTTKRTHRN